MSGPVDDLIASLDESEAREPLGRVAVASVYLRNGPDVPPDEARAIAVRVIEHHRKAIADRRAAGSVVGWVAASGPAKGGGAR